MNWAEKDAEVVSLIQQLDPAQAPSYVLQAAAKSARRQGLFELAETLYRSGIKRFPEQLDFNLGLVLTLTDKSRYDEALQLVTEYQRRWPNNRFYRLANAYLAEKQENLYQALKIVQAELAREPRSQEALSYKKQLLKTLAALDQLRYQPRGAMTLEQNALFLKLRDDQNNDQAVDGKKALILEDLGAADRALIKIKSHPEEYKPSDISRIRVKEGGLRVRWGQMPSAFEREKKRETQEAIEQLLDNLGALKANKKTNASYILQTRFDLMVAWRNNHEMEKVIHEYHLLADEGWTIFPSYVLEALADAWLYCKKPEIARNIYTEIIRQQPDNFNARLGLYYASLEGEDFENANRIAKETRNGQEPWDYSDGSRDGRSNSKKSVADLLFGMNLYYRDELPEADEYLSSLHESAPANTDIIKALGIVYRGRGWPRRSLETLQLGLGLEPDNLDFQAEMSQSLMDLRDYRETELLVQKLELLEPRDAPIKKLSYLWDIHNMRELRLETGYGDSDGAAQGNRDFFLEGTLFSVPFQYNYRSFASYRYSFGSFPEGDKDANRYGAGLEYRGLNLTALGETTWNIGDGGDPGLRLAAQWEANDYWFFPVEIELFSRETPLRALKHGIHADAAGIGFRYRASESREFNLNSRFMDFSDGNFRTYVAGRYSQRLLTYPTYKLTAHVEVDTSSNSKDNTPYFSPEKDLSASLTIDNLQRIWRSYDRSFSHRLMLSGGNYWQQDYGSAFMANACYEQIHEAGYRFDWTYGVCYGRHAYDGEPENRGYFYSRLGWKF